jgi:hypothetical protein
MSTECSVCFDDINVETGQTTMACGHTFHFSCLLKWFVNQTAQENPVSCPSCRYVAGDYDGIGDVGEEKEVEDEEEDDEDESQEEEDESQEETVGFSRGALDSLMRSRGGAGIIQQFWKIFNEEHGYGDEHSVSLSRTDLDFALLSNGASPTSDVLWNLFTSKDKTVFYPTIATRIGAIWRGYQERKKIAAARIRIQMLV